MPQPIPSLPETTMETVSVAHTDTCLMHTQERSEARKDACRRRSRSKTGGETSGGEGGACRRLARNPQTVNKEQIAGGGAATYEAVKEEPKGWER